MGLMDGDKVVGVIVGSLEGLLVFISLSVDPLSTEPELSE